MADELMMTLPALRKRMNMTQKEVAQAIGVSKPTYAKWESDTGDMPMKFLTELAGLFKYPSNSIYYGNSFAFSETLKSK